MGTCKECVFHSCWVECSINLSLIRLTDGVVKPFCILVDILIVLSVLTEKGIEVSYCTCGFVSSFISQFLLHIIFHVGCLVPIYLGPRYRLGGLTFPSLHNLVCAWQFCCCYILKSTLSDINRVPPAFFGFMLHGRSFPILLLPTSTSDLK